MTGEKAPGFEATYSNALPERSIPPVLADDIQFGVYFLSAIEDNCSRVNIKTPSLKAHPASGNADSTGQGWLVFSFLGRLELPGEI